MIPISEIFYSLQGEGSYVGYPAIFIRVGGCNLACPGFGPNGCDSAHSVDAKKYRRTWKQLTTIEIREKVEKLIPIYAESLNKPVIIFTGGEPTIYAEQLEPLVTYYVSRGYKVQFETNGTKVIDLSGIYSKVSFSMSVKLSCSGEPEHRRINMDAINNYLTKTNNSFFKFVCKDAADVEEAAELLKEIPYYAQVYIMPMGETREELAQHDLTIFELCMQYGFAYSDRLHIRMYDDKRGV